MPADLTLGEPADLGRAAVAAPPAAPPAFGGAAMGRVATGQCWRGQFQVAANFGEPAGRWFQARQIDSGGEVHLRRSAAAAAENRARVFAQLQAIENPRLQRPIGVHTAEGERVEVWTPLGGMALRSWRISRGEPDEAQIGELLRQVGAVLESLHRGGLGHCGLRPESIGVRATSQGPEYVVGGLDQVVEIAQNELIPIDVDPHYAPPEAAGLCKHSPGPLLLAWDWWALGRVVQEFLLGSHVITRLPAEIAARLPAGLSGPAEALLLERATDTIRAGAVELMIGLEPRVERLLRGLLTSSAEGRWGADEVRDWLEGKLPADHYSAKRKEHFFRLHERSYSVAEAAEILRGPLHWEQAEEQVLAADHPGTLAHFLAQSPTHRLEREQVNALVEIGHSAALARVPPALRRSITASLALHTLAQHPFRWRGAVLNTEYLRAELAQPERFAARRTELLALSEPVVLLQIRRHDQNAACLLESLVKPVVEAETFFAQELGRSPAKFADPARLWLIALGCETARMAAVHQLRTNYACCTQPALEKLFATPHLTPVGLLVLARVGDEPKQFGFLTHEDVRRRRLAQLLERGGVLVRILFWRRLERAMRAGPMIFGRRWFRVAAGLCGVFLLAVHVPGHLGVALGLAPLAVAIGLRLLANRLQAGTVARWAAGAKPWGWRDAIRRCDAEANALSLATAQPGGQAAALAEFVRTSDEVKRIVKTEDNAHLQLAPCPVATWAAVVVGWLLVLSLVMGSGWYGFRQPPSWQAHASAWAQVFARPAEAAIAEAEHSRISWPYRPSVIEEPLEIPRRETFAPTAEQQQLALARGRQLVASYKRETIDALIAVMVSLENHGRGIVLYDGRKDALVAGAGVRIDFVPNGKTWLGIEGKRVLFIEK